MTFAGTNALADSRVYAQDSPPTDTRDGVIWVDTSVSPRETKVYSAASETFEPVADIAWAKVSDKPANTSVEGVSPGYGTQITIGMLLYPGDNKSNSQKYSNAISADGMRYTLRHDNNGDALTVDNYGYTTESDGNVKIGGGVNLSPGESITNEVTFTAANVTGIWFNGHMDSSKSDNAHVYMDGERHSVTLPDHSHSL